MGKRLRLVALSILLAGLGSGTAIYFLAEELPDDGDGYVIVDGKTYPGGFYQSKRYQRDLERFGGKANILIDEFNRWFASLWQGKSLGITIGWISVAVSAGLFLFSRHFYTD